MRKPVFIVRDCIILRYALEETRGMQIKIQLQKLETKLQQILSLIFLLRFYKTADLIDENKSRTKQAKKIKVLFDQASQRRYVTKRIKDVLRLNEITKEKTFINTFGDSKAKEACLDKVD